MKNLALRMVLACILVLISQVAAFGQEAAKGLFNPEANVQNAITYDSRGLAKEKKGDLDGAMADYNQAIKLNPKDASAYDNRGNVKRKKGDLNGAMGDFNQAIQLNPQLGLAYRNRGNAKKKKGDIEGAIADFNRAIKLGVSTYYSD
jgi:tetratricopeptide (TPR) repeat protein